jgi:hypothetical protein
MAIPSKSFAIMSLVVFVAMVFLSKTWYSCVYLPKCMFLPISLCDTFAEDGVEIGYNTILGKIISKSTYPYLRRASKYTYP